MNSQNTNKFENLLKENMTFPTVYLYKFIVLENSEAKEKLLQLFNSDAEISTNLSSAGKYVSISIKQKVENAEQILEKYKAVSEIQGVTSL